VTGTGTTLPFFNFQENVFPDLSVLSRIQWFCSSLPNEITVVGCVWVSQGHQCASPFLPRTMVPVISCRASHSTSRPTQREFKNMACRSNRPRPLPPQILLKFIIHHQSTIPRSIVRYWQHTRK
jgi:hypothetical protein